MSGTQLATSNSDSAIHRIDSGETLDSPFGSNLATPNDDDIIGIPGIVARLAAAKELDTYFTTGDEGIPTTPDVSEQKVEPEKQPSIADEVNPPSQQHSPMSSLDSAQSLLSPDLSSPETHWTGLQLEGTASSLYSLPNSHIVVEKQTEPLQAANQPSIDSGVSVSDSKPVFLNNSFVSGNLVASCSRILLFLPWCIMVGAVILLSPSHLDSVSVSLGYVDAMEGIHRFSYWAEYGYPHIISFLAFLGFQTWLFPTSGYIIIGAILGQFFYAWHSFLPDYSVPLGSDDFQMVYHLATSFWLRDAQFGIRKVEDRFYADSTGGHIPTLRLEAESDNEQAQ